MIEVTGLVKHYRSRRGRVRAVDGVSFGVAAGETLGLVGESGCGKSTLARLLVRLERPTAGRIMIGGRDVTALRGRRLRELRAKVQLVFQDPATALNPRLTVGGALGEVLAVHGVKDRRRVGELLEMVGLAPAVADRLPRALSGGQRQRVGIARALAVTPDVLVLDEPLSSLDVSVRAEVANLLGRLRTELGLTCVFISHDLGMVRHLADRVAVMYLGGLVELGGWREVSDRPVHPYARALQAAVPVPDPVAEAARANEPLRGELPDPAAPPPGCRFHTRCPIAVESCRSRVPALTEVAAGHHVACSVMAPAGGAGGADGGGGADRGAGGADRGR